MLLAKSIVCESDGSVWKMNISLRNKTLYLLVYGTLKKSNGMNCQLDFVGFYCDSLPHSLTTPIDLKRIQCLYFDTERLLLISNNCFLFFSIKNNVYQHKNYVEN